MSFKFSWRQIITLYYNRWRVKITLSADILCERDTKTFPFFLGNVSLDSFSNNTSSQSNTATPSPTITNCMNYHLHFLYHYSGISWSRIAKMPSSRSILLNKSKHLSFSELGLMYLSFIFWGFTLNIEMRTFGIGGMKQPSKRRTLDLYTIFFESRDSTPEHPMIQ